VIAGRRARYNGHVNADTAAKLIGLNRQFYQTFRRDFSATRQRLQPGVERILRGLKGDERILDLGCGNGELARRLARGRHRGTYLGLDFSLPLLKEAGVSLGSFPANFMEVDITSSSWPYVIARSIAMNQSPTRQNIVMPPTTARDDILEFEIVFALAVLHHIPSQDLRLNILRKAHALLAEGGQFVHSEWQFLNSRRWHNRIQPWSEVGLAEQDVDENDYLLDWRRGGRGLRYVHHFSQAELKDLANASGFKIVQTFHSDGETGNLGLYQTWVQA
jgi:tRNA (uracil-5-)-methyltransferase TRM9